MPTTSSIAQATLRLTEEAAQIALQARKTLQIDLKPDGSIVTNGDKQIEAWLLPRLVELTPGAGFWGEEGSYSPPTDQGFWTLDPIDGTSNFAYGQPLWGVTAAYMQGGHIQLGTIVMPELNVSLVVAKGQGVQVNGQNLPQIPPGRIERHQLIGHGAADQMSQYTKLAKGRHLGAFVVEGVYVCTQQIRAMTTNRVKLYDAAAGILAVRELGGQASYLNGQDFIEADWTKDERCPVLYLGPKDSNFPFA